MKVMDSYDMDLSEDPQFKDALREFRSAGHRMTERPERFWADQRLHIMKRISSRRKGFSFRPVLVWGSAVALVLIFVGIWMDVTRALPAPDFAAGYDQDLLRDVERLTEAQTPIALEPAFLLVDEIKAGLAPRR